MAKKINKQSRQVRRAVEYAIAYDDIKGQAFKVGPRARIGTWGTPDGRKRARALARITARHAMKTA